MKNTPLKEKILLIYNILNWEMSGGAEINIWIHPHKYPGIR
jgi:hypothetical protein